MSSSFPWALSSGLEKTTRKAVRCQSIVQKSSKNEMMGRTT